MKESFQPARVSVIRHTDSESTAVSKDSLQRQSSECRSESVRSSTSSNSDDDEGALLIDVESVDYRFPMKIKTLVNQMKAKQDDIYCKRCEKFLYDEKTKKKFHRNVYSVRQHILSHLPKSVGLYSCEYCGMKAQDRKYIQRHIKVRHMKMELEESKQFRALKCHLGDCDDELCVLAEECFGQ